MKSFVAAIAAAVLGVIGFCRGDEQAALVHGVSL
jgi:hypothetical protein